MNRKLMVTSLLLTVCTSFTSCGADNYNDSYTDESFVSTTDISNRDYDHDKRITDDDSRRKENNNNMSITDSRKNSASDHIKDAADGVGDAGKDVIDGVGDAGKDIIDGVQNAGDELIDGVQDAGENIVDGMDGESETVETLETDDTFTE